MRKVLYPALIALLLGGFGIFIAWLTATYGFENPNKEKATILFIAYMALIYPMYVTIVTEYEKRRLKKTKIVTGSSIYSLEIELNKELKNMKSNTIISVQVIDKKCALIVYVD